MFNPHDRIWDLDQGPKYRGACYVSGVAVSRFPKPRDSIIIQEEVPGGSLSLLCEDLEYYGALGALIHALKCTIGQLLGQRGTKNRSTRDVPGVCAATKIVWC